MLVGKFDITETTMKSVDSIMSLRRSVNILPMISGREMLIGPSWPI